MGEVLDSGARAALAAFGDGRGTLVSSSLRGSFCDTSNSQEHVRAPLRSVRSSPPSIWTDFTRPNETISRVNPGYFTDFKAFFTCSSEIDIPELTLVALEVNTIPRPPGPLACVLDPLFL